MMDIVLYIGISQSFFAALMLLFKIPNQMSDRVLSAWLFFMCLQMVLALVNDSFQLTSIVFVPFVYGPLLYIYCKSLIEEKPVFKRSYLYHFIPLFVFLVTAFVLRAPEVFNLDHFFNKDKYLVFRFIYAFFIAGSIVLYSIVVFVLINKHQKRIIEHYSYRSQKITLGWLKFISICFLVFYLIIFASGISNVFLSHKTDYLNPFVLSYFVLTFFAYSFSIFGYQQTRIYSEVKQKNTAKYKKSGLSADKAEKILHDLLTHVKVEKPYLEGDLTLSDLALQLKISRHHLTQILNEKLNKSFYSFINELRVEEVKLRLSDPEYNNYTLSAIGYECGFNSKSSFQSVFKSYTGYTPSVYKSMNLKKN